MERFWTDAERKRLEEVCSFEEMADVALVILERMKADGREIVQVCGPMSTGGFGNLADNMAHFRRAVDLAIENDLLVFDQLPFQESMIRICELNKKADGSYDWEILEIFYRRVFESGHLRRTLYLEGWRSSKGSVWERELSVKLGIVVEEYPMHWLGK